VLWYAWEARKQARASWHIANASLRPLLEQWIEQTALTAATLTVHYRNFGNGPAVNIRWTLEPAGQVRERVGMGTQDVPSVVTFELSETPTAVVAEYLDGHGSRWRSRLELTVRSGMIENGSSAHSPL
jgi:hypothetical protein